MNIQPYIILNGTNSRSIQGLLISKLAPISKPPVRTQIEEIDGRSGDIVTPLGYGAYDKTVSIGLTYNYDIDEIIAFFNSSGEIIFSNEPDKVYKFAIYDQIDFEKLIKFKTAEITLHVQPYKSSSSETELVFDDTSEPITVVNNGNIYSRPTLTIAGYGTINLILNGSQLLTINLEDDEDEDEPEPQTIIINAEAMNAYSVDNTLLNRLVSGNYDNIKFNIGNNTISFVGGSVSQLKVDKYSRWI